MTKFGNGSSGKSSNAYLVELESVQEIVELPVLAVLLQLDVVLLESVQGQLGLVVDKDFEGLRSERNQHRHEIA